MVNHGAVLNGRSNPNGEETTPIFEYGLDTTYGNSVTCPVIPAGNVEVPVSAAITGLLGSTAYHFRLKTVNVIGPSIPGDDAVFTTLPDLVGGIPTAITDPATDIT